jgi:hypothetical protein
VPGIVLWGFKRSEHRHHWVPTHEQSGGALTVGGNGQVKASPSIKGALVVVKKLTRARYRGKPVDWTMPWEKLVKIKNVQTAIYNASGFWYIEQFTAKDKPWPEGRADW